VEGGFVEDEETVVGAEASGFGDDVEGFRVAEEFGEGICEGDPRCGGEMAEGGGSAAEEVEAFGGAIELAAGGEVVGGADFVMGCGGGGEAVEFEGVVTAVCGGEAFRESCEGLAIAWVAAEEVEDDSGGARGGAGVSGEEPCEFAFELVVAVGLADALFEGFEGDGAGGAWEVGAEGAPCGGGVFGEECGEGVLGFVGFYGVIVVGGEGALGDPCEAVVGGGGGELVEPELGGGAVVLLESAFEVVEEIVERGFREIEPVGAVVFGSREDEHAARAVSGVVGEEAVEEGFGVVRVGGVADEEEAGSFIDADDGLEVSAVGPCGDEGEGDAAGDEGASDVRGDGEFAAVEVLGFGP
jgi:hypothetical protein